MIWPICLIKGELIGDKMIIHIKHYHLPVMILFCDEIFFFFCDEIFISFLFAVSIFHKPYNDKICKTLL